MVDKRKIVLVGTGFVGMSMAYSLLNQGGINELVLIDLFSVYLFTLLFVPNLIPDT